MPSLSVIIPTRNRSERVLRAITSVQAQTEQDLEIVVVDDGSTDGTAERLAAVATADARIRVIRLPESVGAAAARNHGLDVATAEVVAFLDDDDEWLAQKSARQLAALQADPALAMVTCHYEIVDDDGATQVHAGPLEVTAEDLLWCNFVGGMSVLMLRRSRFASPPRLDPELVTCEDWDLALRAAAIAPVRSVPEVLCRYRRSDAGLTQPPLLLEGQRRFVRKHAASMSRDCLAYHRARLRLLGAPSGLARARAGAALAATSPPRVTRMLAAQSLIGRVGNRRGDPGLSLRRLHQALRDSAG